MNEEMAQFILALEKYIIVEAQERADLEIKVMGKKGYRCGMVDAYVVAVQVAKSFVKSGVDYV